MLGLMIYQALRTEELEALEISDLKLREGKISLRGNRRTNARNMALESHQVVDLMDYIYTTRKELLQLTGKTCQQVFISAGKRNSISNVMTNLVTELRATNPKLKSTQQLRTSVIVNWLKIHNLRKVQYLCGHRYVSSTEAYQISNMEGLQEEVKQFHPFA
jgi:integrase/recombinase XerD